MQMSPFFSRRQSLPGIYLLALGLILLLLAAPFLGRLSVPVAEPLLDKPDIRSVLSQLPLAFIPNQAQSDTAVLYQVRSKGTTIAFKSQEIVLQFEEQSLALNFVAANQSPTVIEGTLLPGKVNDFRGSDAAVWQTNIPTYADITYQELYPGIDVRYEGGEGLLKSTFLVAPSADPAQIRWQYNGAAALAVDDVSGNLLVTLPDQSQVVEKMPVAWQDIDGQRVFVPVAYALAANGSVGFTLGSYNASAPLIIDPTIIYETTYNVGDFGHGLDVAIDAAGNAYVLGLLIDLSNDAVITKLSPEGAVLYTTYVRGSKIDAGGGIALDGAGGVYVAGLTDSVDFPILNAIKPEKDGVTREAFITKLAAEDGSLLFSTYFGGSRSDEIHDITLNSAGEIYVVGYTESTDFPTVNPIQGGLNLNQCFCEDTFVTKLSPDAMTVLYSTYLGGSFEDYGQSIALDANNNIYIMGRTQSDDFPTQAAIQPNRASGGQSEDLFVSKISADGSSLVYSTYLGGTKDEVARRIAVDSVGNAFVAGYTLSTNFPTTAGAYEEAYIGGPGDCLTGFGLPTNCNDMFVTKLVPDGSSLAYSTYLGGSLHDYAAGVAINDAGEAYVVGYTYSADIPGVNQNDIIVAKLNANGSDLLYAVGIDSQYPNAGHGIAVDNAGDVYITGAQNLPMELYVAKIADSGAPPPPTSTPLPPPTATTEPPTPTSTPIPPTPTPPPGGDTMHSGDLDGSSVWTFRKWLWQATVTVTVHDINHNPVGGAVVSGAWSGGYTGATQCTTDSNGRCAVSTGSIWRSTRRATFTINNAAHTLFTYTPAGNHDIDGDSDGTTIVVSRP